MILKNNIKLAYLAILGLFITFSCSDDDLSGELTFESPEINLSADSGEFRVGQTIRVTVEYGASATFREFVVQRGNSVIDRVTYTGGTNGSDDYSLEFLITPDLLGTTQTFTFTVVDTLGESTSETFTASVSEVSPTFKIEDVEINGTAFKQVTGRINFDETFDNESLWLLKGEVTVEDITTLTIQEGTSIFATDSILPPPTENDNEITVFGELDVKIGGTLIAEGSLEEPILFNSLNAAPNQPEEADEGDWVGLEINGNPSATNSSILKYIRIEHAGGFEVASEEDVEALRFRDVGMETLVEYIQVHKSGDSGIRVRGGDVNLKYLFVTKPGDRGIRYSSGWQGKGQFWVVLTDNDSRAVNGRDATGLDAPPVPSNGVVSNVTLIGPNILGSGIAGDGARVRDGAKGEFHNFLVTGFDNSFRGVSGSDDMLIKNSVVFGNDNGSGLHSTIDDLYLDPENENSVEEIALTDTFVGVSTTNSSDASTLGEFFDAVNFTGAVSPDNDWTLGWTINFDGTPRE